MTRLINKLLHPLVEQSEFILTTLLNNNFLDSNILAFLSSPQSSTSTL
jgi:hypothetical protein